MGIAAQNPFDIGITIRTDMKAVESTISASNGEPSNFRRHSLIEDARAESARNKEVLIKHLKGEEISSFCDLSEQEVLSKIKKYDGKRLSANFVFSLKNDLEDDLPKILNCIKQHGGNIRHMETRSSRQGTKKDVFTSLTMFSTELLHLLSVVKQWNDISVAFFDEEISCSFQEHVWYPKNVRDLDKCGYVLDKSELELDSSHPGFNDQVYRARRAEITQLAFQYKQGEMIPRVDYTDEEINTWGIVFNQLRMLYPKYACSNYLKVFKMLEEECGYRSDNIPQLQDVSSFLKNCIHELLGHVPMLADSEFAKFSQEIGLASLGASDEDIEKLATIYWFTVEFGFCREDEQVKAYGAGLLSSYGELQHAVSGIPRLLPFDPLTTSLHPYQDQVFQDVYFVSETFQDAKEKIRNYVRKKIRRRFDIIYDPYTESIQELNSLSKIEESMEDIASNVYLLKDAVKRLQAKESIF